MNTLLTHCLACRKKTGNTRVTYSTSRGRRSMSSVCSVCGRGKHAFVTAAQGGKGIVDRFIENLPVELHLLGSVHHEPYQANDASLKGAKEGKMRRTQFTGPGTRVQERYARGERGINDLDHAAMYHDLAYMRSTDPQERNRADQVLKSAAEAYLKKPNLTLLDKVDARIVKTAMDLIKR